MTTQATQADPTLALAYTRRQIQDHGFPTTPAAWMLLMQQALSLEDPTKAPLVEVAERARYVYDQWVLGDVSRQNGMDALRKALEDADH